MTPTKQAQADAFTDPAQNKPCPTCKRKNALTPKDVALGYQCDRCADYYEDGY